MGTPANPGMQMSSGLPGLDQILQGVLAGDNVVLEIDSVTDDYLPFVHPFCRFARDNGIRLIYFRFAQHRASVPEDVQAEIHHLHPEKGFENFINEIYDVIEEVGRGAYYVFDCLSELAVDWYSERMLGNFFRLTCPYLYEYDTVTFFALLKNHHTADALSSIHNTAQVVLEIFSKQNEVYLQPRKADRRHSSTIYMLHRRENEAFNPVTRSALVTEILSHVPRPWLDFTIQRIGVWQRQFQEAQEILDGVEQGKRSFQEQHNAYRRLMRMAITRDERFLELAERFFDLSDLLNIRRRMIGTGLIGGKSVGMLLSRKILERSSNRWSHLLEEHDSFFIGSDVFYSYIVHNKAWHALRRLKKKGGVTGTLKHDYDRIMNGAFPEYLVSQFSEMLDYFGQSPIIVRSSSVLEDAFGNAFSGKYESVFCANQGDPGERLASLIDAVRTIYASVMSEEAILYRQQRGLLHQEEQMGILVQRVSGNMYGEHFFPHAAGVGFSFNPYTWSQDIDPQAGMLRLVFGLGTRAVDRSDDDYTRVVALNAPMKQPESSSDKIRKYAQHKVDLLDLGKNRLETHDFAELSDQLVDMPVELFATKDPEVERLAREHGMKNAFPWVLTFSRLLGESGFVADMREMLKTLQNAYDYPVDVEFTANVLEDGSYRINLVQCRPFQVKNFNIEVEPPHDISTAETVLRTTGPIIGNSIAAPINWLVYVKPSVYGSMPQTDRYSIARLIGELTHTERLRGTNIMLVGPGRWGTTTPSLGVPVTFAEINTVSVLCELVTMRDDLIPDVSLGTHFFNDLVELDMLYMALFPDRQGAIMNEKFLLGCRNALADLLPEAGKWTDCLHLVDCSRMAQGDALHMYANTLEQLATCYIK